MTFQSGLNQNINIIWSLTKIAELKSYIEYARVLPSIEAKLREQALSQSRPGNGVEPANFAQFIKYIEEARAKPGYVLDTQEITRLYQLISEKPSKGERTGIRPGGEGALEELAAWLQNPANAKVPPPLLAIVAYNEFLHKRPFAEDNRGGAMALGIAVLYIYGYHFRGMLPLDRFFDLGDDYDNGKVSSLVETFCSKMESQLADLARKIQEAEDITSQETFRWIQRLNPRQSLLIQALQRQERITAGEFKHGYLSGAVSRETIRKDVVELLEMGLIEGFGSGRSRYYELKNPLLKGSIFKG